MNHLTFNSIQFILYSQYHKLRICLYNLYTYDIAVPGPHIGSGKTLRPLLCLTFCCLEMQSIRFFVDIFFLNMEYMNTNLKVKCANVKMCLTLKACPDER